jgi:hypothetical protein
MLDHAFESLGLHRIALAVFEFNERAIRSYRRVGFRVEGRAREAIWRDGRWWDEIQMSVLAEEWRAVRSRLGRVAPTDTPERSLADDDHLDRRTAKPVEASSVAAGRTAD